jgi:hypothetical protein
VSFLIFNNIVFLDILGFSLSSSPGSSEFLYILNSLISLSLAAAKIAKCRKKEDPAIINAKIAHSLLGYQLINPITPAPADRSRD